MIYLTAYFIAFGNHGPRAQTPPGEGWKVFAYTMVGVAVSFGLFSFVRMFGKGVPPTLNKEWQEATNEYLKVCGIFLFFIADCHCGTSELLYKSAGQSYISPQTCNDSFPIHPSTPDPLSIGHMLTLLLNRHKTPSPSQVSHPKATQERAKCKASPRSQNRYAHQLFQTITSKNQFKNTPFLLS